MLENFQRYKFQSIQVQNIKGLASIGILGNFIDLAQKSLCISKKPSTL